MRDDVPALLTAYYSLGYRSAELSGGWGQWQSQSTTPKCSHNPELRLSNGERDIASVCMPVIGPYDSTDPDLCEYHVLLAMASGLDGFIVDSEAVSSHRQALDALFHAAETLRFKLAFRVTGAAAAELAPWFASAAYLQVSGRPLVLLDADAEDVSNLFVVREWLSGPLPEKGWKSLIPVPGESLIVEEERWKKFAALEAEGRLAMVSAMVIPGIDDRACQEAPQVISRRQGETYALAWENVLQHRARLVHIRSWNQHTEGSAIEPVKENVLHKQAAVPGWGYRELLATREYASQLKQQRLWPLPALFLPERLYRLRKSPSHEAATQVEAKAVKTRGDRIRLYLMEGDIAGATLGLEQAGV